MIWAAGRKKRAVVGVWWEQGFWDAEWASGGDGFGILIARSWVGKKSDVWACCQGIDILCSLLGIQSNLRDPEKREGENLDCYLTTLCFNTHTHTQTPGSSNV